MTNKEKSIIYAYFYNNYVRLEDTVRVLQSNIRYRDIDTVDCIELVCAIERFHLFCEVSQDIRTLLRLSEGSGDSPEGEPPTQGTKYRSNLEKKKKI